MNLACESSFGNSKLYSIIADTNNIRFSHKIVIPFSFQPQLIRIKHHIQIDSNFPALHDAIVHC